MYTPLLVMMLEVEVISTTDAALAVLACMLILLNVKAVLFCHSHFKAMHSVKEYKNERSYQITDYAKYLVIVTPAPGIM